MLFSDHRTRYFQDASLAFRRATYCIVFCLTIPAFGALGSDSASVLADQAQMQANVKVAHYYFYSVHELKMSSRTIVREYVAPNGRVFGVTWQGPFVPSMRQLLGTYFSEYTQAAQTQREKHVGRQPLKIYEPTLVVRAGGHMLDYWGRAYDPQLVPAGVSVDDIR